ncbi:hypothetical protein VTN00DRAFT_1330 [Thermoascus crustaceus]|uniref:uncharacterized protein n=1 Tax=Thermoascus crustaceus TaxID=5088 RepID=UPI003741F635
MFKLSQLFDSRRPSSADANADSSQAHYIPPQSPLSNYSSAPVSPAVSVFSTKAHTKCSSSVSSLVSSPAMGNSMEPSGSVKTQLMGVKEEPMEREDRELEADYFQHFDQYISPSHAEDYYFSTFDTDGYDLTDAGMSAPRSPKKRRSDSSSVKGVTRIGFRISKISARWKAKYGSDAASVEEPFTDGFLSRADSVSSNLVSPVLRPVSKLETRNPPSPARTFFEERLSESGTLPLDIEKANSQSIEELRPKTSTPLLPPFMGGHPTDASPSAVHSPLQSPSVADVSEEPNINATAEPQMAGLPSPPLSSRPSMSSISRTRANTVRTISGDGPAPFIMSDPSDEWAHKLGHANFTIKPEPYVPETCDVESFQQLRADWDLARCNYAKHLVRTGEHYGVTSKIYKLTEEKWDSINRQWKQNHKSVLAQLEANEGAGLSLTKSNIHPCEAIKIPRLHDNAKFPELGDQEIVGPMTVAPMRSQTSQSETKSAKKRSFFKFIQDLISRSYTSHSSTEIPTRS